MKSPDQLITLIVNPQCAYERVIVAILSFSMGFSPLKNKQKVLSLFN